MDQQEREQLADQIGLHIGWYIAKQTECLIEAMPCTCVSSRGGTATQCNRCEKLEKLKETT